MSVQTANLAGWCATAFVLAIAIGVGGCATTWHKIDDLTLVGLRKMDKTERDAHPDRTPRYMSGKVYNDSVYLEVTLSTSFDFVPAVNAGASWAPYPRQWQCALGEDDGPMNAGVYKSVYEGWKQIGGFSSPHAEPEWLAHPRAATNGRHFYTIYIAAKDEFRLPSNTPYDLVQSPVDVCVTLTNFTILDSVSLETNVVQIPGGAIATALSEH